jgi:mannose-6-phosphate isomerase-like protein (cupin superfamily)
MKLDMIHSDYRGAIWTLMIDGTEHTFLKSNKGYARGGCVHKFSIEHVVILEGSVEYHIQGKKIRVYKKGQSLSIQPNRPHYFVALENSTVVEWGPSPEEKKEKHPEWRKVVDQINASIKSSS